MIVDTSTTTLLSSAVTPQLKSASSVQTRVAGSPQHQQASWSGRASFGYDTISFGLGDLYLAAPRHQHRHPYSLSG
jgi:hypothetical protein